MTGPVQVRETSPLLGEQAGGEHCCNRAELLWATDDLLVAAHRRRRLPTDAIDALPPWRAKMIVQVCLHAGAQLEHGTEEQFFDAADLAGRADPRATGWWRAYLSKDPALQAPPAPRSYHLPAAGAKYTNRK